MAFSRSLVPHILRPTNDWWDIWDYPSRIFDQNFGLSLSDEDASPIISSPFYPRPRMVSRQTSNRGMSEVKNSPNDFQVSVDVSAFAPNEITVKAVDNNCVIIEAKHEERPDEHGFISRSFTRRYMLPKGVQVESVQSSLSAEGILSITVPKKAIEPVKANEKVIPINLAPVASPMTVDSAAGNESTGSGDKPKSDSKDNKADQVQEQPVQQETAEAVQDPKQTAPVSPGDEQKNAEEVKQ